MKKWWQRGGMMNVQRWFLGHSLGCLKRNSFNFTCQGQLVTDRTTQMLVFTRQEGSNREDVIGGIMGNMGSIIFGDSPTQGVWTAQPCCFDFDHLVGYLWQTRLCCLRVELRAHCGCSSPESLRCLKMGDLQNGLTFWSPLLVFLFHIHTLLCQTLISQVEVFYVHKVERDRSI